MKTPSHRPKTLLLVLMNAKCIIASSRIPPTKSRSIRSQTNKNGVTSVDGNVVAASRRKNRGYGNTIVNESYGTLHDDDMSALDELIFGHRKIIDGDESTVENSDYDHDDYSDGQGLYKDDDDVDHDDYDRLGEDDGVEDNVGNIPSFHRSKSRVSSHDDVDIDIGVDVDEEFESIQERGLDEKGTTVPIDSFDTIINDHSTDIDIDIDTDIDIDIDTDENMNILSSVQNKKGNVRHYHDSAFGPTNTRPISQNHHTVVNDTKFKRSNGLSSKPQSQSQSPSQPETATYKTSRASREIASNLVHEISQNLRSVLNGKVAGHVPCDIYGESLDQEIAAWKTLYSPPTTATPTDIDNDNPPSLTTDPETLLSLEQSRNSFPEKTAARQKLYGGAQYHRTLRSFHHRIRTVPIPFSTSEEIALLMGGTASGQMHDGADILRSVAVLASGRMELLAGLLLDELAERLQYVLERMWTVVEYTLLVRPLGDRNLSFVTSSSFGLQTEGNNQRYDSAFGQQITGMSLNDYDATQEDLMECITRSYEKFVQSKVACAHEMAKDDIFALLKFVTWDWTFANNGFGGGAGTGTGTGSTGRRTDDISRETDDYNFDKFDEEDGEDDMGDLVGGVLNKGNHHATNDIHSGSDEKEDILATIVQAIRSFTSPEVPRGGYSMARMHSAINMLVQRVTESWRHDISQTITTKFNSFCLLPFHEEFEAFLRSEIEQCFLDRDAPVDGKGPV